MTMLPICVFCRLSTFSSKRGANKNPPIYAKLAKLWLRIGSAMLRVRNQCNGSSGASAFDSIEMNSLRPAALAAKHARVGRLVHPHCEPCEIPASNAEAPTPKVIDPAMSNFTLGARAVSGSNHMATTTPRRHSGACTKKMARQPTASTSAAPATTPMTGAPALTKLQ